MIQTEFLRRFVTNKHLRISLGILVVTIILFGLLGYFWLPGYAKNKLETVLSETVHRPVSVQSIDIQPYTLEVTVRGFRVGEKAASADSDKALFSVDELYVNLSTASIFHRAPVASSVIVKAPMLRLVREGENRFNITDLIEEYSEPLEDVKETSVLGRTMFSVSNVVIEDGRFEFVDQFKKGHQKVSEINLSIPFISSFESHLTTWIKPYFSAKVNGAPFALNGKLRPFSGKREAIFEFKLNNIDLTRIDEYSPIPLGISLLSGYFDSDLQLIFSQETGESSSIVLSGHTSLREFEIENRIMEAPYNVKFDQLDVMLNEIDLSGQKPAQLTLVLSGAVLTQPDKTEPILSLSKLSVNKIVVDPTQKNVALGVVKLDQFKASIRRETDGQLNLTRHFTPLPDEQVSTLRRRSLVASASEPWTARIDNLKIADAALHFEDLTLTKVVPMVVEPLNLTIDNIDLSGAVPLKLALQATVNQRGSLETNGSLAWAPLAFDFVIDAKDIDLVSLQGWAGDQLNALLTRGEVSFQGKVKADGEPLKIVLSGKSRFTNFNILDKTSATDLLRWRRFDIGGIKFVNEPLRVDVASVAIADFFANVIISPEGEINLKNIVRQDNGTKEVTSAQSIPATTAPVKSQAGKVTPLHIGRVILQGGNVNFDDQFIKPNYHAKLTGIAGRIGPLNPGMPGEIDIRGAVDKSAPLKITGKVDPFGSELFLDIDAKVTGVDLPTFSPYSSKYVGYVIEKGKLSVDIRYHIKEGELKAEHHVFLDQLTLGEKIESPDALDIPVTLAVALLKNQNGEIDINLAISGSLNDPEFSIGGVIVKVIVNLLTKAVTAPFAMLGSLFGGGEELSEIDFLPGYGQVEPEAEKRLQALSKALTDRPALQLEITGYADPENDREGLKRAMLERKVKAQKLSEGVEKGEAGGSLENVDLKPEEYEKFLELAYEEEKFAKPKNVIGLIKDLPVPEMEQLMLANINAGDDELRQLAEQRAKAARDWLVEEGGISSDRIFVSEPKIESEADGKKLGSRAKFSLE